MRTPMLGAMIAAAAIGFSPMRAQEQAQTAGPPAPTLVFFSWDKPEIDSDAAALLDAVAASFVGRPGSHLLLAGHTDRSGPAAHNLRSGKRRADAVRDYLVARGVPAGAISTLSFGEERPIIATDDGVREAQNRRVEIGFGAGPER